MEVILIVIVLWFRLSDIVIELRYNNTLLNERNEILKNK